MIYSNSKLKSKYKIQQKSIAEISAMLKKSKVLFIDTETCPKSLDKDKFIKNFITVYEAQGKKITAAVKKYAENAYQEERKKHSLDPYLAKVRLIQIKDDSGNIFILDSFQDNLKKIITVINEKPAAFHNAKFDVKMLITNFNYSPGEIYDTMIGHKLIMNGEIIGYYESNIGKVVKYWTGITLEKGHGADDWGQQLTEEQVNYSIEDVMYLDEVVYKQIDYLNKTSVKSQSKKYWNNLIGNIVTIIEMKFIEVLAVTELTGIPINIEKLTEERDKIKKVLDESKKFFEKQNVNILSPAQLFKFLNKYEDIDITSTSKDELLKFVNTNPVIKDLLTAKKHQKLYQMIDDYINIWTKPDGRIYAEYNQMRAVDGRMSCSNPNMQQIPRALKNIIYKANKGKVIIKADYPAIEARLMGVIANDKKIIDIFKNNKDMHTETAASFLNKPPEEVTPEERRRAKAANFGFMFGMGALSYTKFAFTNYNLIVSVDEAVETREKYMARYSGVFRFHNRNSQLLRDNYEIVITTLLGRKMKCDKFTNANNYPVQGSAVDMIKLASNLFYYRAKQQKIDARIINIVHDEIVIESSVKDKNKAKKLLEESMNTAADFIIKEFPTKVETEEIK